MATVFSPEAIAQGHYPHEGDQQLAREMFLHGLGELALAGYGVEGLVYGSATRTSSGYAEEIAPAVAARGDLDAIVRLAADPSDDLVKRLNALQASVIAATHVPVDRRTVTDVEVGKVPATLFGDHLFVEHLILALHNDANVIGQPMRGIPSIMNLPRSERVQRAAEIAFGYLVHKTDTFTKALDAVLAEGGLDIHAMQRALELPVSLWRKVGRVMQLGGLIDGDVAALLDRRTAEMAVGSLRMTSGHVHDRRWNAAMRLIELNAEYNRVLAATIRGTMTVEAYRGWLVRNQVERLQQAERLTWAVRRLVVEWFLPDQQPSGHSGK